MPAKVEKDDSVYSLPPVYHAPKPLDYTPDPDPPSQPVQQTHTTTNHTTSSQPATPTNVPAPQTRKSKPEKPQVDQPFPYVQVFSDGSRTFTAGETVEVLYPYDGSQQSQHVLTIAKASLFRLPPPLLHHFADLLVACTLSCATRGINSARTPFHNWSGPHGACAPLLSMMEGNPLKPTTF